MILSLLNLLVSQAVFLTIMLTSVFIAIRHQRLFLVLFMFVTALGATRDYAPQLSVTLSGISLYPEDIFTGAAGVGVLVRIGQWRIKGVTLASALVQAVLVALGVLTWTATYGIEKGANPWRPQILAVALLMYAVTRPRPWTWDDLRILIIGPAIVVGLASTAGILLHGLGSSTYQSDINGVVQGGRPVEASGALLMLVGLWVAALSSVKRGLGRILVIVLLAGMVLLTQHRSVWVASLFGITAWWLVPRIHQAGRSESPSGSSRTILMSLVAVATGLIASFVAALGESSSNDVTWEWRANRWADSMDVARSWVQWLVGSAFGPTPASTPTLFPTSAHSLYVNSVEMTGFIGLAASLWLVIALVRTHMPGSVEPLVLIVSLSYLSFGVTYQLPGWAWMLAGILLTASRAHTRGPLDRVRAEYSYAPDMERDLVQPRLRID